MSYLYMNFHKVLPSALHPKTLMNKGNIGRVNRVNPSNFISSVARACEYNMVYTFDIIKWIFGNILFGMSVNQTFSGIPAKMLEKNSRYIWIRR